jgi:hypothetical protein
MIVDEWAKLMTKVAALSSDEGEQKKTIAELLCLHEQLAQVNEYLGRCSVKALIRDRTGLAPPVSKTAERVRILRTAPGYPDPTTDRKQRSKRKMTRVDLTKTFARCRHVFLFLALLIPAVAGQLAAAKDQPAPDHVLIIDVYSRALAPNATKEKEFWLDNL